jgi:membrane protein required for colicin V production
MSFTLLDIGLFAIMLISGLLALTRGFTREVLALLCWGGAAIAAFFLALQPNFRDFAKQTLKPVPEDAAPYVAAAVVFVILLIVLSLMTMRISDWILDSGIGALDRTLGFVFGMARGLVLVAIAFIGFVWLVEPDNVPQPVRDAQSLTFIQQTASFLNSLLPPDIANTLEDKIKLRAEGGKATGKSDPQNVGVEEEEPAKTTLPSGIGPYLQSPKPAAGQAPAATPQPGIQPQKPGTTVQQQPLPRAPQQPQAQQQQPPPQQQPQKRN